jgi:hypothetical protein
MRYLHALMGKVFSIRLQRNYCEATKSVDKYCQFTTLNLVPGSASPVTFVSLIFLS